MNEKKDNDLISVMIHISQGRYSLMRNVTTEAKKELLFLTKSSIAFLQIYFRKTFKKINEKQSS